MDTQTKHIPAKPVKHRPVSRKVTAALHKRVYEALSWDDCAKAVGLSPSGIHKARLNPEVKALFQEIKAQYVQQVEDMKAPHKARAFEVARDLLDNSTSDAVKARMVEFFAGESRGTSINVGVSVNNQPSAPGYEYVLPGQEVVTLRRATDTQSGAHRAQDPDIIEHQD